MSGFEFSHSEYHPYIYLKSTTTTSRKFEFPNGVTVWVFRNRNSHGYTLRAYKPSFLDFWLYDISAEHVESELYLLGGFIKVHMGGDIP